MTYLNPSHKGTKVSSSSTGNVSLGVLPGRTSSCWTKALMSGWHQCLFWQRDLEMKKHRITDVLVVGPWSFSMVSFGGRYDELAEHCTVHTQHRFEFEFVVIYEEKWHFFVSSAWSQLWSNHVGYLHILLAACTCSTVQSTRPIPLRGALVVSGVSFPKMIFASLAKWHTTRATAGWRWDFGVLAKILVSWVMLGP